MKRKRFTFLKVLLFVKGYATLFISIFIFVCVALIANLIPIAETIFDFMFTWLCISAMHAPIAILSLVFSFHYIIAGKLIAIAVLVISLLLWISTFVFLFLIRKRPQFTLTFLLLACIASVSELIFAFFAGEPIVIVPTAVFSSVLLITSIMNLVSFLLKKDKTDSV